MKNYSDELRRRMYRGGRPNQLARLANLATTAVFAAGIWPRRLAALEVRGRVSGRTISFPVVIADCAGERYLVSMLGEKVNWVRNVRAAGGDAVLRHGRREEVRLIEVPDADRAPVLRRYLDVAPGGRAHIPVGQGAPREAFEQVAPQIPVFRITPRSTAPPAGAGTPLPPG